jgi:signal transduction histidine kinase
LTAAAVVVGLAAGAVGAVAVVSIVVARWVLVPVRALARSVSEVAAGRSPLPVAEAGPPEVRLLVRSVNEMAVRVETSMQRQHAFVAEASHQIRNALTALIIRLDNVAARTDAQAATDVERTTDEIKRLAALLERLLALSRAEYAERPASEVAVSRIVRARVDNWVPVARARSIELRADPLSDLHAWTHDDVVAQSLDAVLDNAIKFSPEGSVVQVWSYVEPDEAVVCVRDHGTGLSQDELAHVGERFWRSASHAHVSGFGLGLSIVRSLLEAGGGGLVAVAPPGGGLEVRLAFPRRHMTGTPLRRGNFRAA